jgi:RNA polymerase sigma factor (sigma-70 family)
LHEQDRLRFSKIRVNTWLLALFAWITTHNVHNRRMAAGQRMDEPVRDGQFAPTHWSVVITAGRSDLPEAADALEKLCRAYWYPLYAYVRRQGNSAQDAEDLTQQFFYRLVEKDCLAKADRDRGKFRTFLIGSLNNFLINEWKWAGRLRRGGNLTFLPLDALQAEERYCGEPVDESNPADAYERLWGVALVEQVFAILRAEYASAERVDVFEALKGFIWGDPDSKSYGETGERLNLTEGAVKVAVHRLRKHFREVVRAQVAHTVARPEDVDEELRHLISVLSFKEPE